MNTQKILSNFFAYRNLENHYRNLESSDKFSWIIHKSNLATLHLHFDIPYKKMYDEANSLLHEFVYHRDSYNEKHKGWKSLTIHGRGKHYTLGDDQYENNLPEYHWTEICDQCPVTTNFLKNKIFLDDFLRIRFMLLEPNGYILPHKDDDENRLQTFNISLNNPEGCIMGMEDYGIVPWKEGQIRMMNISIPHAVWNKSNENRIHMIIHGWSKKKIDIFKKVVINSYRSLV